MKDQKADDLAKAPREGNEEHALSPFGQKDFVSVQRAATILGVSTNTVLLLHEEKVIEMIDYRPRARKRVKYASIVELCDKLRLKYGIADRRPPLSSPMFRHKDEDLLPFPMRDTIRTADALSVLGYESMETVRSMIEEGLFEGYQLREGGPWRISRRSLRAFLDRKMPPPPPIPSRLSSPATERRALWQ